LNQRALHKHTTDLIAQLHQSDDGIYKVKAIHQQYIPDT